MFQFVITRLENISLQRKLMLIIMLTSSVALTLACAGFVIYDLQVLRRSMLNDLTTLAKVVGQMNTAALQFDDPSTIVDNLLKLRDKPTVVAAAVFRNGKIIGSYVRVDMPPSYPIIPPSVEGSAFKGSYLEVFQPIVLDGEKVGAIFVQSDLTDLSGRIRQYVLIACLVVAVSSGVALLLSSALQKVVSRPILGLAQAARKVSVEKNYSVRASKSGNDELGELIDAFNEMLSQIQSRDAALQAGRDQLEKRVEERTQELQKQIAERERAEIALRASELRFRSLVQSADDAIVVTDDQNRIVTWNKGAQNIFGFSEEEALAEKLSLVLPEITGGTGRQLSNQTTEVQGRRKDGSLAPLEISSTTWEAGGLKFQSAIIRDITERKEAVERLQAVATKLERSNRELQDFAYVASHDLQEPLRKVQAFGERLNAKFAPALGDEGRDFLARMQNAARRMQNLINDLLLFSRVTTKANPFQQVDLARIVSEVLSDLEVRIQQTGGKVKVRELPTLEADPSQMRQLMQNLISNSLKFHKPGVPPVVEISASISAGSTESPLGPICEIRVEDNGIGFEEKYLDRVFAVFQRLHGRTEYEGTGIGLAICRKIAERHLGHITARSTPGRGSIFIVRVPIKHHKKEDT